MFIMPKKTVKALTRGSPWARWIAASTLMVGLLTVQGWATPVSVDGVLAPEEWGGGASISLMDADEPGIADGYDIQSVLMRGGSEGVSLGITSYAGTVDLLPALDGNPKLAVEFCISAAGVSCPVALSYQAYTAAGQQMGLIRTDNGQALDTVPFASAQAVEMTVPWSSLPVSVAGLDSVELSLISFEFSAVSGDITGDGTVGIGDLCVMSGNWNQTGKTFLEGDLNGDGLVSVGDLSLLAGSWGLGQVDVFDGGYGSGSVNTHAPEPITALGVILAGAAAGGYTCRRRKAKKV